ncbi:MAG: hypothetical protein KJ731_21175 [Alphaproteobacteria bacterium]|uniref:Uncharacterized protein n=1 Tax=viral metagenome TaxID=1070528 RepID=A0A6M3JKU7_9ZZZZ|nr:hypothetical protein [Alphaproteobacteria bacterium]MBU1280298.1 hypothetical protein [Alphaproteobacteria bacterium]MBU1573036.1 hypothetical protein [Alphaproteobacteria bacterium]MBU1830963.1 hypothetical protein [Alphaproteobacteria bacterium]MBU2079996.1 hypothetical protein [Alphaproteobacteria bacterium]
MIPQDIEELRKINPYAADEAEKEAARHGSNDNREQGANGFGGAIIGLLIACLAFGLFLLWGMI